MNSLALSTQSPHHTNNLITGIQTHLWGFFSKLCGNLDRKFGAETISLDFLYKSFK